jgi:hypothetical protein
MLMACTALCLLWYLTSVAAHVENIVSYTGTDVNESNFFAARLKMRGNPSFKSAQK